MIRHHPAPELLCEYAAGCLHEAPALAVATHASLCGRCAHVVADFEAVGGALIEAEPPAEVSPGALDALFAAADCSDSRISSPPAPPSAAPAPPLDSETMTTVPAPLRAYLGRSLSRLPWRRRGLRVAEAHLALPMQGVRASLVRVKPGAVLPRHSHRGLEFTVLLAGGFTDHGVAFGRGDFVLGDPTSEHHPVVDDAAGCLCLVILDAPVRLLGAFGRLLNPFLRI